MRNIIVHYHIFKNAGTSIDRVLEENFGAAWASLEGSSATSLLRAQDVQAYVAEHPGLEAVSSHLARPPLPQGFSVLPIVFLRHPLDRAASVHSHERRAPATVKSGEIAKTRDFRGYVQWCLNEYEGRDKGGTVIRNYQVTHLSDASFRNSHIHKAEAERHDLRQAIQFLSALPFLRHRGKISALAPPFAGHCAGDVAQLSHDECQGKRIAGPDPDPLSSDGQGSTRSRFRLVAVAD